jgi:hypothetical protein
VDVEPEGPEVERIELALDLEGKPVRSERHAVDLMTVPPDPILRQLLDRR